MSEIIFPLDVQFDTSRERQGDGVVERNFLILDSLIRRKKNKTFFVREHVKILWTPTVYVVSRTENISRLRRIINAHLQSEKLPPINRIFPNCDCRRIYRDSQQIFWKYESGNFIYSIEVVNFRVRRSVLKFLRDNCHQTELFGLPILQENLTIDIFLRSYLHSQRDEADDDDDDGCETKYAFEMCTWCTYDKINGNYVRSLNANEIERNNLPKNPLDLLPILSYDIETIAKDDSTLPRGIEYDQAVSSIAITIHSSNGDSSAIVLLYTPLSEVSDVKSTELRLQKIYDRRNVKVLCFQSEIVLLHVFFHYMRDNSLVKQFLQVQENDLACLLIGYNSFDYDYTFLYTRLIYHGLYDLAMQWASTRYCFANEQIPFDMLQHIRQRHHVDGSYTLDNVSTFFGATSKLNLSATEQQSKMKFDAVSIRHLYVFNGEGRIEMDKNVSFSKICTVIDYNVQDCFCVYFLMKNVHFSTNLQMYSSHFFVNIFRAANAGNSCLLPHSLFVSAVKRFKIFLETKNRFSSQWYANSCTTYVDRDPFAFPLVHLLNLERSENAFSFDEGDLLRVENKKYIGGYNSAIPGHYVNAIHLDFKSFYPSIACEFGLSFETVRILPLTLLKRILLDAELNDVFRCFDYEPLSSSSSSSSSWYEGIEYTSLKELNSKNDNHRIMTVRSYPNEIPTISSLWSYYLEERAKFKKLAKESQDFFVKNFYLSMEQMYKRLANSLYGYLNYNRSHFYAPAVAAAITLLARKTFHETIVYLLEEQNSRVVYADTDGLIFVNDTNRAWENDRLIEYGRYLADRITKKLGYKHIVLELENVSSRCIIMGKKKYWYCDINEKVTSKGFERNISSILKHTFLLLQTNVIVFTRHLRRNNCYLMLRNLSNFFHDTFTFVESLIKQSIFQLKDLSFNLVLTPRTTTGKEAEFIDKVLRENNYDIGDKVRCIFKLDLDDVEKTEFVILNLFNENRDHVNIYKFLRRIIMYVVQVVEGCKRNELPQDHPNFLTPIKFNRLFVNAYRDWCENYYIERNPLKYKLYGSLFVSNDSKNRDEKLFRDMFEICTI